MLVLIKEAVNYSELAGKLIGFTLAKGRKAVVLCNEYDKNGGIIATHEVHRESIPTEVIEKKAIHKVGTNEFYLLRNDVKKA